MTDTFRDLLASIVSDSVTNGSGRPMLTVVEDHDDEPTEGDEQWIDHDGLTEWQQDQWR